MAELHLFLCFLVGWEFWMFLVPGNPTSRSSDFKSTPKIATTYCNQKRGVVVDLQRFFSSKIFFGSNLTSCANILRCDSTNGWNWAFTHFFGKVRGNFHPLGGWSSHVGSVVIGSSLCTSYEVRPIWKGNHHHPILGGRIVRIVF